MGAGGRAHVRELLDDGCEAAQDLEVDVGRGVRVHPEVRLYDDLRGKATVNRGAAAAAGLADLCAAVVCVVALHVARYAGGGRACRRVKRVELHPAAAREQRVGEPAHCCARLT